MVVGWCGVVGGGGVCRGGNGRAAALVVACDVDVSSRFGAVRSRAAGHTHTSVDEAPRARASGGPAGRRLGNGAFRWLGFRARAQSDAARGMPLAFSVPPGGAAVDRRGGVACAASSSEWW